MTAPLPGDFGCLPTFGNALDREVARVIQWDTESPYNHAVLCKDAGTLIEAQPGGATESPITKYGADITWSTGHPVSTALTDVQRATIVRTAEGFVLDRVGYGYLDFAAIAFEQARWHHGHDAPHDFELAARLLDFRRLICSQAVDVAYLAAGVHLFADGRAPGLVSPGDLGRLISP